MQLKLLNFHKMLANFSANLVGGFISLIIYRHTQSLFWAIFYLIAVYASSIIINQVFRKQFVKHPQLFLVLRSITILAYSLSVLVIDKNFILGIVLVIIFYAADSSFKGNSSEIILNYSVSQSTSSKSFGLTRAVEHTGVIIAVVTGGFLLDNLDTWVLTTFAISVYLISTIPLLMYYIRSRKIAGFNTESVSNATVHFSQNEDKTKSGKRLSKQILLQYGFVYFLVAFLDVFCSLFNLYIFVKFGQFAIAGIVNGIFNGAYVLGSYLFGYLNGRHDITIFASICLLVNGICAMLAFLVTAKALIFILFGIVGFLYPIYSLFLIERLLVKTRILGVSNKAIFIRENATALGKGWCCLFALFGTVVPAFFAMGVALIACSVALPANEESTRKALVKYLEG